LFQKIPTMEQNTTRAGFSLTNRVRSVRYAIRGIRVMLQSQHNAWIHAFTTVVVVITGLVVGLSAGEWCWITLAVMAVWTAEALNTALEFLTDMLSPDYHDLAGKAKDVAAGAVLIAATGAMLIGVFIFYPYF
jgi:diacylglycerol kinase (ATP)